jgi:Na+/H+ antiporter NhaD/arsenite permease-like protein
MLDTLAFAVSALVILLTLAGVAIGRYPGVRMNRATIAVVGATALVGLGTLSIDQAYQAIDLNTLVLLFAMMVINANLRMAGFFELVAARLAGAALSPRQLLAVTVVAAGVLSALFLNDTIVLVFTPLVVQIVGAVGLNPIPYLIALATAANVGSTATIIGNPQNMLIGVSSGISFTRFFAYLSPVALGGFAVIWLVIALVYKAELRPQAVNLHLHRRIRVFRPLLVKSSVASVVLLVVLIAGVPVPLAALVAASMLLITRRLKPERVFREIDWSLLVFFSGLFVVTAAVESVGLNGRLLGFIESSADRGVVGLTAVSAVLSNLISNVPAVMLLRSVVPNLADPERGWLTLAMSSTLAGNLTLLGSVANLIVAETARRQHVTLSFWEYLKTGVPITILTLMWGAFWLIVVR